MGLRECLFCRPFQNDYGGVTQTPVMWSPCLFFGGETVEIQNGYNYSSTSPLRLHGILLGDIYFTLPCRGAIRIIVIKFLALYCSFITVFTATHHFEPNLSQTDPVHTFPFYYFYFTFKSKFLSPKCFFLRISFRNLYSSRIPRYAPCPFSFI